MAWMISQESSLHHCRHSRVIIDLDAIRYNYQFLKSIAPDCKVVAVIKADAYGHGAIEVARALPLADAFAVATTQEAISLRKAHVEQKIIVLGGVVDEMEMQDCVEYRLDPVFHQLWQIDLFRSAYRFNELDIWLKYNSGMGRLGFSKTSLEQALAEVNQLNQIGTIRLMTHLANADDVTDQKSSQQLDRIKALDLQQYEWGIANSAGILGWPHSRLQWVRSGIALYGSDPLQNHNFSHKLKPAMTFKSRILAINHLKKGQTIGYGGLYICSGDKTIAVISAGYADGYPRHLKQGYVLVKGHRAPVVGRISMDMITIDATEIGVQAGDEVTLWGDALLAEEIASLSETISYELFCHAGCHGKREYLHQ